MPENQQACRMKTIFDLPPDLVREVKLRAVHEGRTLNDVAAELLRRGLADPVNRLNHASRSKPTVCP